VTVCIAALCRDSQTERYVVCVADRMLTAGEGEADVEYEPLMPKLIPLTNSIAVLTAGDAFLQREVLLGMFPEVTERIERAEWWTLRDMADLYLKHLNLVRRRRSEQTVLVKYGLTFEDYTQRNRELAPTTLAEIIQELQAFDLPEVSTILAGTDPGGTHIYTVRYDGIIRCHDSTGFAALGTGARHASSQFMLAKHSLNKPLADTLRLTYFAKKRSEVAPGVGGQTDMCLIGPGLGASRLFEQSDIDRLEALYRAAVKDELKLEKKAQEGIQGFIKDLKALPAEQSTPEPPGPIGPTDPE
jgi:hypothetical protein